MDSKAGAARARPEYRRMMSASDRQHLASSGVRPRPDCSGRSLDRPRGWVWRGSGTDPEGQKTLMSATGPDRSCAPHSTFRQARNESRPGGWLCTVNETARQRNPDGLCLLLAPAARYGKPREAFLPPGRKRSRSIRQRERHQCGTGRQGVDEMGVIFGWDGAAGPSPHWWGRRRISAPWRQLSARNLKRGVGFSTRIPPHLKNL